MSCGVGHRRSSDPTLLWLWHRLEAVALIWPLAWELLYATGAVLKSEKKKEKKKRDYFVSFTIRHKTVPFLKVFSVGPSICHSICLLNFPRFWRNFFLNIFPPPSCSDRLQLSQGGKNSYLSLYPQCLKQTLEYRSSLVAERSKNQALSLQEPGSLLWHRFSPWPGNIHMLQVQPNK